MAFPAGSHATPVEVLHLAAWIDMVDLLTEQKLGEARVVSMTASGTDTPASSTITPSLHHGSCQVGHTPMHIGSGPCFRNSFGQ